MIAGIIGAMEPEVAILKAKLVNATQSNYGGYFFYQGQLDGSEVVIVQSGIGKVAAALAVAMLLNNFQVDYVVNTGSAGGFDAALNVGDIVVSSEVRYHDVDLTAFGYEVGQLPANPAAFMPHPDLVNAANLGITQLSAVDGLGNSQNIQVVTGLITTGDTFMTKDEDIAKARANFPTMAAVEMEGAAIAQACLQLDTPFVVIRSLSDIAGEESPHTFEEYLATAAINSSQLVLNMLAELKGTVLAKL